MVSRVFCKINEQEILRVSCYLDEQQTDLTIAVQSACMAKDSSYRYNLLFVDSADSKSKAVRSHIVKEAGRRRRIRQREEGLSILSANCKSLGFRDLVRAPSPPTTTTTPANSAISNTSDDEPSYEVALYNASNTASPLTAYLDGHRRDPFNALPLQSSPSAHRALDFCTW